MGFPRARPTRGPPDVPRSRRSHAPTGEPGADRHSAPSRTHPSFTSDPDPHRLFDTSDVVNQTADSTGRSPESSVAVRQASLKHAKQRAWTTPRPGAKTRRFDE